MSPDDCTVCERNVPKSPFALCWCHYVSVVARKIFKEFPEARQVDKETPYNERRKMGHFSWTINESSEKLIVNFYVVHKVCKHFLLYKHSNLTQQLKCMTQINLLTLRIFFGIAETQSLEKSESHTSETTTTTFHLLNYFARVFPKIRKL